MSIGIPIKLLHEAKGQTITVETTNNDIFRGKLIEVEDNMNCQMGQVAVTYRGGKVAQLDNAFIQGAKVRLLILPDKLKNDPMFRRQMSSSGRERPSFSTNRGRGRSGPPSRGRSSWQSGSSRYSGGSSSDRSRR